MKSKNDGHLREEQITWAAIDEKELDGEVRFHLRECLICQRKVEQFEDVLLGFGDSADKFVPPMTRTVKLPVKEQAPLGLKPGWLTYFGAAAMAGIALFIYFLGMDGMSPQISSLPNGQGLLEDESLMQEISEMVENPFSEGIYVITGEFEIGFDDEFLEFVVPDTQEDFQSQQDSQGGIMRC